MLYVISDIHGNLRRFKSILSQINLQPDDTLYILGDVIDRHSDGIRIHRLIMASPNMKMLLGNHEYMMLRALGVPYDESDWGASYDPSDCLYVWYRNGGGVTHRHIMHIRKQLRSENCGSGYSEDPNEEHYALGRLSCLRLDDMQEFYSEECFLTT